MKKILNVILLCAFAFFANPAAAQPPGHLSDWGSINPQPLYSQGQQLIWTVTNHTNCEFNYNLFMTFANDKHEHYPDVSILHSGDFYTLGGNSSIDYNFTDLYKNYFELTNIAMSVNIFGNVYSVYPNGDGQTQIIRIEGSSEPCSCFRIDFNASTKTIDVWPCQ